ncbi:MAG: MATE family efflux transporter [Lachnospiraceae bacterium]|nr:MATE family efflux transporter [Lachnospiraceae bacterium]
MRIKKFEIDTKFYKKTLLIVLPIVIQNLLSAAVGSADVIMLNYVGQSSISAASLATQYASIIFTIYFGIGTGVTMLSAQYFGKGDIQTIEKVEGIALRFALGAALIFTTGSLFIPDIMMKVYTNDTELIGLGASYLRVVAISFLCWAIGEVYLATLRSIGRVTISTIISSATLITNVLLNGVFIFGIFGAPKLGIIGVALATTISRVLELILCIIVSIYSENVKIRLKYVFQKQGILFKDFIQMSLPALLNDVSWGLAFSMYSVIMGHMGSDVVAANSIVSVVRNFGSVFCFGIASASNIVLGQMLGENRLTDARNGGRRFIILTVIAGAIGGLLVFFSIPFVVANVSLSGTALKYLKFMLYINTYYIVGAAVNTTLIAGIFRAGGDSRFGFVCDTIDMWLYAVPLGLLSAFVLKLPVEVVYFLLLTDEFVKWPWVFKHYASYKWVRNITREEIK